MPAGYTVPERESLTEDEAGAEILKLAKSFRATQGQTEDGNSTESVNATESDEDPQEEVEADTLPAESADETEIPDEQLAEEETEEEPEPTPKTRGRTLKFEGREEFVSEEEAYNGFLRQRDYTQKTQTAAEKVKAALKRESEASQRREQYDAGLKQIEDALKVMMPQEPDWDRVRQERPDEYGALYTDWRRYQDRLALVQRERDAVAQEAKQQQELQRVERRKDHAERLFTLIPEWRDAVKRDADRVKISNLAREHGFNEDEIAEIEDPRWVVILRESLLYRDLKSKQAKVRAQIGKTPTGSTRTAKPGTPGSVARPSSTKAQAAVRRLAKSGDVEDAADAIFHALRAKPKRK